MSQTTLAELSVSLSHVQSLLKQITAEVKVLSDGIAVLVEQEEADDVEEELSYLDVDPWSNVNDKDKNTATASRRDSIRSLMQRKPSTVKDETKALARILSTKRTGSGGAGSGSESEKPFSGAQQVKQQQPSQQASSRWSTSNLQEQIIDEDYASSEGSSSYRSRKRDSPPGDKHELETSTGLIQTADSSSILQAPETERVPHTITVQTTQLPTKYSIAIIKPNTPQSPSAPVLSSSISQNSVLGANSAPVSQSFWRSSTTPNMNEGSRPASVAGSIHLEGSLTKGSAQALRRSLQPEPRSFSDNQLPTQSSVTDRYTQSTRSGSHSSPVYSTGGRDSVKSTLTTSSSKPMVAAQVEKMESADCFSKLGLIPELLRGIYAYGLKMPSILQQRGIPMIMTRYDVLTQAKPEVAKTLTYAIPLLNFLTLPATSIHPQLLIICSNHDLCLHVQRVLLALARFMPTISCLICAEGSNATLSLGTMSTTQVNIAGHGSKNGYSPNGYGRGSLGSEPLPVIAAHVVIGTPAKVLSLVRTKQISLAALKVMVLENADILLLSPLKEATISLLSMVRDPVANAGASGSTGVSGLVSEPLISPPNSGPTSPVSKAVAALNGRIMSSGSDSRPRSSSSAAAPSLTLSSAPLPTLASASQPQLLFFSTEVPSHVLDHVAQYMTQPTKALVKGHELALKGILQFFKYMTVDDEEWQTELLCEMLEESGANRAAVFCNSDESVERVVRKIRERKGFAIGAYSDMDLTTRKAAVGRCRGSATPVYLVLTDDAAKDVEILSVPLVVSFEMPSVGNYIPRVKWIDRSKGKVGAKVTLVDGHKGEGQALRAIQYHYRTTIDDMPASISEFIVN
ncbi:Eukaryotic initiation factor 4A-III [Dissophora globulifera]|uniref:RNA helicase n=1 Tax=Dissophora globulifera TaxID=979702 RepID=A0A9P6RV60_9FUNG|nr:Eukaryotic initiation factor 4A-III [Dissophora globulifera]